MNDYNYKYKHKKRAHTRDESERREKVTSLRSSETELKKIQKNAKDAGMSVNNYLNIVGANGRKAITPAIMVQIQNAINYACSMIELHEPDAVVTMQEGVNDLWQKLM